MNDFAKCMQLIARRKKIDIKNLSENTTYRVFKKEENPLLKFSHGCKKWARNFKISANVLQHLFYQQSNFS